MIAYASSRPPTKVSHQEETYIVVFSLISEASDLEQEKGLKNRVESRFIGAHG